MISHSRFHYNKFVSSTFKWTFKIWKHHVLSLPLSLRASHLVQSAQTKVEKNIVRMRQMCAKSKMKGITFLMIYLKICPCTIENVRTLFFISIECKLFYDDFHECFFSAQSFLADDNQKILVHNLIDIINT